MEFYLFSSPLMFATHFSKVQVPTQDQTLHHPLCLVCCSFSFAAGSLPSAYKDKQSFLVQKKKKNIKNARKEKKIGRKKETLFDFSIPSSDCLSSLLPFKFALTFLDSPAFPSFAPHPLVP